MRDLKPKILFVDDEELAQRTFKRIAEKEFRVVVADSVDAAIKVLDEESDDIGVLLSDQRMPGRLGVDLLEHCRKYYPKIVRMLTTAYSELDDAIAAVNRGEIMRYIEKPWGNIDGLLIDLRVAMSLFEMQAENDHLMAEKLSMGFKTSRLDKVRALIAIAACQDSKNNLRAVEVLLRQLAEIEAYRSLPSLEEMQGYQVFGQPLSDSIGSIEIGSYIKQQKTQSATVPDLETMAKDSSTYRIRVNEEGGSAFSGNNALSNILLSAKAIFGGAAEIEVNLSSDANANTVDIVPKEGDTALLRHWWAHRGVSPELNTRIGALLYTFLATFDADGHAELALNDMGLIEKLQLRFDDQGSSASQQNVSSSYDWIDDLMILFS